MANRPEKKPELRSLKNSARYPRSYRLATGSRAHAVSGAIIGHPVSTSGGKNVVARAEFI